MSPTGLGVLEDKTIHTEPLHQPLLYVLLVFLWTGFLFYSSLVFLDERIHLQVGQEEEAAARRLYEVNQFHLHEERESALRRELEEIQFEGKSLYRPGSTCNIGSRKKRLHLLQECKPQRAT